MKVSFYLPIYRKKLAHVKKCVESLLDQSHKDVEVICVFDGPDPIVESYIDKLVEDGKVKKINIEHSGACRARNEGLKACTGDIVCAWDADCYIEPDYTAAAIKEFEKDAIDMVYCRYRFSDPSLGGHVAEPYDPWTLKKYNYISSMTFIRRDRAPNWDVDLIGLQDWDYARTCAEYGLKAKFLEVYGFVTEIPDKDSISGPSANVTDRIETIRKKWGDRDCDILVMGDAFRFDAIRMAKILDADSFNGPYWIRKKYKLGIHVGVTLGQSMIEDVPYCHGIIGQLGSCEKKALYWMGFDAEKLYASRPFGAVKIVTKELKKAIDHHFCDDRGTQDILGELGIEAEVINFPIGVGEVSKSMPEEFKVFVFTDNVYSEIIEAIIKAMPQIKFERIEPGKSIKLADYSAIIQYTQNKRLELLTKLMLVNGRYPVTNVQAPYSGYISTDLEITTFKNDMINRIKELSTKKEINKDAQNYYLDLYSSSLFLDRIRKYVPATKMEVI